MTREVSLKEALGWYVMTAPFSTDAQGGITELLKQVAAKLESQSAQLATIQGLLFYREPVLC